MLKKLNDKRFLTGLIVANVLVILFDNIFSGFWKALAIIATVVIVLIDLYLLFSFAKLKIFKIGKHHSSGSSNSNSKTINSSTSSSSYSSNSGSNANSVSNSATNFIDSLVGGSFDENYGLSAEEIALRKQIEEEEKQLSPKELKMWRIYYDYKKQGYKFASYEHMNTPLKWKKNVVPYLLTQSVQVYKDHLEKTKKYEQKEKWKEDHPILTNVGKGVNYVFSGQLLYDAVDKISPYSSNSTSVKQKDSAEQAAKDIKRILRSSGTYSDGSNGSCHYYIQSIYADKYDRVIINVSTSNFSYKQMMTVDIPSQIRDNLKQEIYDSAYPESGGYSMDITVY